MTIRFTDECPNCEKNIKNYVEELDDKFFEPFDCPFCEATLEFKKGKYRLIAIIGGLLIISLLASIWSTWCNFDFIDLSVGCPTKLKDIPWQISQLLIMLIIGLLWIQDISLIKQPTENKKT